MLCFSKGHLLLECTCLISLKKWNIALFSIKCFSYVEVEGNSPWCAPRNLKRNCILFQRILHTWKVSVVNQYSTALQGICTIIKRTLYTFNFNSANISTTCSSRKIKLLQKKVLHTRNSILMSMRWNWWSTILKRTVEHIKDFFESHSALLWKTSCPLRKFEALSYCNGLVDLLSNQQRSHMLKIFVENNIALL